MAKVKVDVENILKKIGEGDKPAYSLKVVKEVANHVETLFRREGFGIINDPATPISTTSTGAVVLPEEDLETYVPKFKNCKPSSIKREIYS